MKRGLTIALFSIAIIELGLCGGCASADSPNLAAANGEKFFVVKVDSTPFYRYGPQQASRPEMTLPKDTLVTLVQPSFGWCKVELASGNQGYVANDDLTIAPSATTAVVNAPPARRSRTVQPEPDFSRFIPPEPLPDIEPTPIPIP